MDNKPLNPLAKHFRQPAIYYKLPSSGKYWKDGSLLLPANEELPVYPMTARDEIALKTPDALLNGQGVIDVIQSCCPNIKDAWAMPSIDVDATLIAIRIASYGNNMDVDVKCPHCNEGNSYTANLGNILSNLSCPDYQKKVEFNEVAIKLAPQSYFSINETDQIRFEEQQVIKAIGADNLSEEERMKQFSIHMQRIVDLNIKILLDSTEYVQLSDGTIVTDKNYIKEYYDNCEAKLISQVKDRLAELLNQTKLKPMEATCTACEKEISVPLNFDYSNFFVNGS